MPTRPAVLGRDRFSFDVPLTAALSYVQLGVSGAHDRNQRPPRVRCHDLAGSRRIRPSGVGELGPSAGSHGESVAKSSLPELGANPNGPAVLTHPGPRPNLKGD